MEPVGTSMPHINGTITGSLALAHPRCLWIVIRKLEPGEGTAHSREHTEDSICARSEQQRA